jgi:hypothetical protein
MAVWVGDFDGDRDTDIVAGAKGKVNGKDRPVLWFENLAGDGRQWRDHWLPEVLCGDHHDHSRTYDFDGDGRDEIIVQKYHGSGIYYLAPADNSRGDWKAWKIGVGRAGVSLYDVNRDGRMDVLVGHTWLENPGNPAREGWKVHTVPHSERHVKNAAGDLNGDGVTDFAHAEEEGNDCYVILSPKWERVTLKSDGKGLHTMRLEDFDKDGDLDLVTADIHGGHAYVFENRDGKGTQWVRHDLPTWSKEGSHNLWTADLNGDGLTDIFGKHYSDRSALEVWLNRCEPAQARAHVRPPGVRAGAVEKPFGIHGRPCDISRGGRYPSIISYRVGVAPEHLEPGESRIAPGFAFERRSVSLCTQASPDELFCNQPARAPQP